MRGNWCGGFVSLCVAAFSLGFANSAILANEPNPEAAIATPSPKAPQSSYKPYFFEFRARSAASYGHMYVILRPGKRPRRNHKKRHCRPASSR